MQKELIFRKHLAVQVLCFEKLIFSKERNPQIITNDFRLIGDFTGFDLELTKGIDND